MARVYFSLAIWLIWIVSSCGPSKSDAALLEFEEECDSLQHLAELDFAKGLRDYTQEGTIYLTDFEMFYTNYMERRFGVRMKASCTIDVFHMCYSRRLNFKLEELYGDSFTDVAYKEAQSIWKAHGLSE